MKFEYCKNGELLQYIKWTNGFPENIARYYFHQLVQGLSHIHKENYCHLDLKLENILLDDNFSIKIIDFGFSQFQKKNSKQLITKYCGTPQHYSPEIYYEKPYEGHKADIFSLGVCLFKMVTNQPIFLKHPIYKD